MSGSERKARTIVEKWLEGDDGPHIPMGSNEHLELLKLVKEKRWIEAQVILVNGVFIYG